MKPKTLILTVVAVTCGLGASYMTSRLLAERGEQPQEKVKILVAKKNLDQGLVVKDVEEAFVAKEVPLELAEKDTVRVEDALKLKGRQLRRALKQEAVIRQDDFLGEKEMFLEGQMTDGYRAFGIRVNTESIAAGFASLPHSRVDIISTVRRGTDKESFSQVLLENVLVLAADTNTFRDESGRAMPASVVTVALKPEDVVKVSLAREMGPLSLVLRKFNDLTKSSQDLKFTGEQLLARTIPSPTEVPEVNPTEPAHTKPLEQPKVAVAETKPVDVVPVQPPKTQPKAPEGKVHRLKIFEGDRERTVEYRLDDNGEVISPSGATRQEPGALPQGQAPSGSQRQEPAPASKDGN